MSTLEQGMNRRDGEIALTKAVMRNIETATGVVPQREPIWPTVTAYLIWATVIICAIGASIYSGGLTCT